MKVYITKYALTKGIIEADAEKSYNKSSIYVKKSFVSFFHKDEWFENKEDAIKKAEEMRKNKIISLKKQIAKLDELSF